MSKLRIMITDFDGTLVDTFEANFRAYEEAFARCGLSLSEAKYRECFGFRFDRFMEATGVDQQVVKDKIKEIKGEIYPNYFSELRVNKPLVAMLDGFKKSGGIVAVASTARKKNLINALEYIGAKDLFDLIVAGEDVVHGKPNPEIYLNVLSHFQLSPSEALVYEDSLIGMQSAEAAGISYVEINSNFYAD